MSVSAIATLSAGPLSGVLLSAAASGQPVRWLDHMLWGLSVGGWVTALLILAMLVLLAMSRFGSDIIVVGILFAFLALGILKPEQAFSGFASQTMITVAVLFVVAEGLQQTGALTMLTTRILGKPKTALQAQARLVLPVAAASAFLNNTPLVAMFMPVLSELSKRTGIAVGRLFMPLSFAAILGGVCTLIGTSTNLVVAGSIEEENRRIAQAVAAGGESEAPLERLGMWTLSPVGGVVAVAGIAYILLLGRKLLPARQGVVQQSQESAARKYTLAMRVATGSPIVGKSIEAAGLRQLPGLFLSRIDRGDETLVAVSPGERLQAGDVLGFVGVVESVVDLQKIKGLEPVTDGSKAVDYRPRLKLVEAVISPSSPLVGQSIREAGIRDKYSAVVIAVHRHGARLEGKIGDIVLQPGDTLLLESGPKFARKHRDSEDFYLVSEIEGAAAPRHERAPWAILVLLMLIVALTQEHHVPVVISAMGAAGLMIVLRCCTGPQARSSIEWPTLIVIGSAYGVGMAMKQTGLAHFIAESALSVVAPLGPWGYLAAVYVCTVVCTAFITNNAAAALMFPIALEVSRVHGLNFMPFAVAICIGASCQFDTPIGYQTNLMVMGPGGYKWLDYTRFGLPLTVLCAAVALAVIPLVFPLR